MDENTKNKKFAGKYGIIIIIVLSIAFVSLLTVVVVYAMKDSFVSGMPEEVRNAVFAADSEIAYNVDSDSVISMAPYGNGIVILTDTSIAYVDENGDTSAEDTHTFISPAMTVSGNKVLTYSILSNSYRLDKNCKTESEKTSGSALLTCALGKKGNYAVCTYNDDGYTSRLKVFDADGNAVFEWGCASDYITSVALSDNGRYAAVAVTGAANAESYSKIMFFEFKYTTEKYTVTIPDTTAYSVAFTDKKTVLACADNGVYKIDFNGKEEKLLSCISGQMKRSDVCPEGLSAFCVNGTEDSVGETLYIFNKKMEDIVSHPLKNEVQSISCSDKNVAVAYEDRIEIYNDEGELQKTVTTDMSCIGAVIEDNSLFILYVNGISICSTR